MWAPLSSGASLATSLLQPSESRQTPSRTTEPSVSLLCVPSLCPLCLCGSFPVSKQTLVRISPPPIANPRHRAPHHPASTSPTSRSSSALWNGLRKKCASGGRRRACTSSDQA